MTATNPSGDGALAARKRRWWRALRVGLYLLFLLGLMEGVLRIGLYVTFESGEYSCHPNRELAGMSRYYRAAVATEAEPRPMFAWDPFTGHWPSLRQKDRDFADARVSTNSEGLRGTQEYPAARPAGQRRIIALGDSFTFGDGVNDDEVWPAQLASMLPKTDVINLGVSGFGHDQMYFALRERGQRYGADIVLLLFIDADMARNCQDYFCYFKPVARRGEGGFAFQNVPVPHPDDLGEPFSMVVAVAQALYRDQTTEPCDGQDPQEVTAFILDELHALCRKMGSELILVTLPDHGVNDASASRFLKDYTRQRHIRLIDQFPAFDKECRAMGRERCEQAFVLPDRHLNGAGNRLLADGIREALTGQPRGR